MATKSSKKIKPSAMEEDANLTAAVGDKDGGGGKPISPVGTSEDLGFSRAERRGRRSAPGANDASNSDRIA